MLANRCRVISWVEGALRSVEWHASSANINGEDTRLSIPAYLPRVQHYSLRRWKLILLACPPFVCRLYRLPHFLTQITGRVCSMYIHNYVRLHGYTGICIQFLHVLTAASPSRIRSVCAHHVSTPRAAYNVHTYNYTYMHTYTIGTQCSSHLPTWITSWWSYLSANWVVLSGGLLGSSVWIICPACARTKTGNHQPRPTTWLKKRKKKEV